MCTMLCVTELGGGELVLCYQLNAHFLYSITIYMLHYNPQHVLSSTLLIFRRTNCIITAVIIQFVLLKMSKFCSKHVEDYNVQYILL